MVRVEVRFHGHVQGVGFRYTTNQIAKQYPCTGIVRNETDGSVYLVAEGERHILESFIEAIRTQMSDFIQRETVNWSEATHKWPTFSIDRIG